MTGFEAFAQPAPSPAEISATLAPFVLERYAPGDARCAARRARLLRTWRLKLARRRLFGWLPRGRRTQAYVEHSYDRTFAARPWPETLPPSGEQAVAPEAKPTLAEFQGEGLLVRRYGLGRVHLLLMARVIRALGARTVLEVGAGTGINLFVLQALVPEASFTGIELTETGVAQARTVIAAERFPARLAQYCPAPVADADAYRRVDVRRGNALDLPFAQGSFDLVFTRQALEQMEMIRTPALKEIARVARAHTLFVEPFADANRDALRRAYVAAKDYFSLGVDGLRDFGIEPVHWSRAFPQNVCLGIELVVGRIGV
ncbi:MAG: class I SAM-dependent methyltransferase [Alphaproteobacteria bacterium]